MLRFWPFSNLTIGISASALASALQNFFICLTYFFCFGKNRVFILNAPPYSFWCLVIWDHYLFATITDFSTISCPTSTKLAIKAAMFMLEPLLSTPAGLPGNLSSYLEQLLCREPGGACFCRK